MYVFLTFFIDVEEEEEEMVGVTVETEVMEVTEMDAEMVAEMGAKKTDEQRQQQQMLNVAIKLFRTKLHKEKSQGIAKHFSNLKTNCYKIMHFSCSNAGKDYPVNSLAAWRKRPG